MRALILEGLMLIFVEFLIVETGSLVEEDGYKKYDCNIAYLQCSLINLKWGLTNALEAKKKLQT